MKLINRLKNHSQYRKFVRNNGAYCIFMDTIDNWWSVVSVFSNEYLNHGAEEVCVCDTSSDVALACQIDKNNILSCVTINGNVLGKVIIGFNGNNVTSHCVLIVRNVINADTDFDKDMQKNNGIIRLTK